MPSTSSKKQLRLRVFAGPNGSGKSTVINYIKKAKVNGRLVDFGFYINADDIARTLVEGAFTFSEYEFETTNKEFQEIAVASGLINKEFDEEQFKSCYSFRTNQVKLKEADKGERLAQIIADFLRKKLLSLQKRFSFETVFSHESKLEIMQKAKEAGYKVYLYFVSTESPEINKFRVKARVAQNGHDVPPEKIETRYYRSMDLLYKACQIAYQAFFFDNSEGGRDSIMFGHFKVTKEGKSWDLMKEEEVPVWFLEYYSNKINS